MRIIPILLLFLVLRVSLGELTSGKDVLDTINAIPSLSKFSKLLNTPTLMPLRELLKNESSNITVFAPDNEAMDTFFNDLQQRFKSGGLNFNITQELQSSSQFFQFETCPVSQHMQNEKEAPEHKPSFRLPEGVTEQEYLKELLGAIANYSVVNGSFSLKDVENHMYLPTLLHNESIFVALNGSSQRMHIENISATHEQRGNESMSHFRQELGMSNSILEFLFKYFELAENNTLNVSSQLTNITILFGEAFDPLPSQVINSLLKNGTTNDPVLERFLSSVVVPDLSCTNGVIHIVNRVIEPPGNLSNLALANITTFIELLNSTGLLKEIEAMQNVTILAPSNEALKKYGIIHKSLQSSNTSSNSSSRNETFSPAIDKDGLLEILKTHLLNQTLYPTEIKNETLTSFNGQNLTFNLTNIFSIQVNNTNITGSGLLLRNGVLHILDGVLIPQNVSITRIVGPPGSNNGSYPSTPGGTLKNDSCYPSFPPGKKLDPADYNCPSDNGACSVIDFLYLRCATQFDMMSTIDSSRCAHFNFTGYPPTHAQCYNLSTHTCVNEYFLCPLTHPLLCGVQCYSKSEYNCYETFSLCPTTAPMRCGPSCYSPSLYSCDEGRLKPVMTSGNSTNQENQK